MSEKNKVFNLIRKIVWGIIWAIFAVVFFITSWLFVDKFIFKSPVPSFLGYSSLTIETGSMSGTMEIGDMIIIKNTGDYKIGDIVTFMPEGATIPTTHRIINYSENGEFVTKGDANNVKDTDNATKEQIIGEVVLHLPQLGQFASWVKQEGWIYIISVLVIIMLGSFILKNSNSEQELQSETASGGESSASESTFNESQSEKVESAFNESQSENNNKENKENN